MTTGRRIARRLPANGIRAPRRGTAWDDNILNEQILNNGQNLLLLLNNVADPEKRGCTLVRVILNLWALPSNPGQVSGSMQLSLGIAMMSDDAFSAAAVAEADVPSDYPPSGWLYRDNVLVVDETLATGAIPPTRIEKDLRASRKLDRQAVAIQMEASAIEGTNFTLRVCGMIRSLYKLP